MFNGVLTCDKFGIMGCIILIDKNKCIQLEIHHNQLLKIHTHSVYMLDLIFQIRYYV